MLTGVKLHPSMALARNPVHSVIHATHRGCTLTREHSLCMPPRHMMIHTMLETAYTCVSTWKNASTRVRCIHQPLGCSDTPLSRGASGWCPSSRQQRHQQLSHDGSCWHHNCLLA